ncbi:MAG: hypothetical protein ACXVB9_08810 [Bdellovibrionota bacterium]
MEAAIPLRMLKLTSFSFLFLLLPALSQAALINPRSGEGKKIVHKLANKASQAFVSQTEQLQGKGSDEAPDCESVKSALLADLSILDVSSSSDLASAKLALEGATCSSADDRKTNDHFFAATVSLRSLDGIN